MPRKRVLIKGFAPMIWQISGRPLKEVIETLQEFQTAYKDDAVTMTINLANLKDKSRLSDIDLEFHRDETEAEMLKREAKEADLLQLVEEAEFAQYLRLKEKYETK